MTPTLLAPAAARMLHEVLAAKAVQMAFQPVVHLNDGSVQAYEALARFERRHFGSPAEAFAAAMAAGIAVQVQLEHLALERALGRLDDMPTGAWLNANLSVEA